MFSGFSCLAEWQSSELLGALPTSPQLDSGANAQRGFRSATYGLIQSAKAGKQCHKL
jgi:hypothetical protein